jgi:hypothetical protein
MDKVAGGGFLITKTVDNTPHPSTVADPSTPVDEKAERDAERESRPVPLLVRMFLWFVLLLSLTLLFFYRLGLPVNEALGHYAALAMPKGSQRDPTVKQSPGHTAASQRPDRTLISNNPDELTQDERALLGKIKEHLATLLVERQASKASKQLEWEHQHAAAPLFRQELDALRPIISAAAQIDKAVIREFESKIGKDVTVRLTNGVANIRLQAISGENVCGAPISDKGVVAANSVMFKISSMDPIERSRWLGAASTPDRCSMKFLLYMEGGDYESAAAFAVNCGPLAEAFRAIAKNKQSAP